MSERTSEFVDRVKDWLLQEHELDDKIPCRGLEKKQEAPQTKPMMEIETAVLEAEVLLMSASSASEERALLERMSTAISSRIAKAHFIHLKEQERELFLESLFGSKLKARWILISEMELYQIPELLGFYSKAPKRQLGSVPIFFLADLKAYNSDPELKRSLWNTLLGQL